MSAATELAKAEADRVEAELGPDDPEPPTPDDDTPPETGEPDHGPKPVGEVEIRKAERQVEAHRKALAKILGDEAVAATCLLCTGLGHLPFTPEPETVFSVVAVDDGVELAISSPGDLPPFAVAPDRERCGTCDGWGQTLTGARPEAQPFWQCTACNGNGWVAKAIDYQPTGPVLVPQAGGRPLPPDDDGISPFPWGWGEVDRWGRANGEKFYGVAPWQIPATPQA